jgi:hypothetical protein
MVLTKALIAKPCQIDRVLRLELNFTNLAQVIALVLMADAY